MEFLNSFWHRTAYDAATSVRIHKERRTYRSVGRDVRLTDVHEHQIVELTS